MVVTERAVTGRLCCCQAGRKHVLSLTGTLENNGAIFTRNNLTSVSSSGDCRLNFPSWLPRYVIPKHPSFHISVKRLGLADRDHSQCGSFIRDQSLITTSTMDLSCQQQDVFAPNTTFHFRHSAFGAPKSMRSLHLAIPTLAQTHYVLKSIGYMAHGPITEPNI
jgi:hypothetical protein